MLAAAGAVVVTGSGTDKLPPVSVTVPVALSLPPTVRFRLFCLLSKSDFKLFLTVWSFVQIDSDVVFGNVVDAALSANALFNGA